MTDAEVVDRQYWLWVTGPDYYQDEDGSDRKALDPDSDAWMNGGWTCHKDTQRGDLVLLYRTAPKSDIGYLIQADSDARFDDEAEKGWDHWCEYRPLHRFRNPVTITDLRNNPKIQDWGSLRRNFVGRVHEIPPEIWTELTSMASEKESQYRPPIDKKQEFPPVTVASEKQLEDHLVKNLGELQKFGYNLELYREPQVGLDGRQYMCKGNRGRIDLLCKDIKTDKYVVIELKVEQADYRTFGQICNYICWAQENLSGGARVEGLVISRGADDKFKSCLGITDQVRQANLSDIGVEHRPGGEEEERPSWKFW